MLKQLKEGLSHFQKHGYEEAQDLYHELKDKQAPHTLLITCGDSRIMPERLLNADPGEVFLIRNVANTVPHVDRAQEDLTTMSAVEFAVEVLQVDQVVVCGHSNCGGCKAVLQAKGELDDSYLTQYLTPLLPIRDRVLDQGQDLNQEKLAQLMEKTNAVEQMQHLKSYAFIQDRINQGDLEVEAWHYDIESGQVQVFQEEDQSFKSFTV